MIRAKPAVEALQPYQAPLEGRREKLRLDFNENTVGPSPKVMEAIRALPPTAYATYPEYAGLQDAFAAHLGVGVQQVAVFNGVDAAIRALFDAYGDAGSTLLTTEPTFGYYGPCAAQQGMRVTSIRYTERLTYPLEAIRDVLQQRPRLCFICNPNNPTGTLLEPERILELARAAPETLMVIDELYADYAGATVLPDALGCENLVTVRSLSKSAGIAALRIGFAIGCPGIVQRLVRVTGPYDVNMIAVVAARAALADREYVSDYITEVRAAKQWTMAQLEHKRVRYHAGSGNFLLVWPPGDNARVVRQLDERGILVRCMNGRALIDESFRLTIGTRAQMERFFQAFFALIERA